MTILDAIEDQNLFRPLFKKLDTWRAWLVVLKALFALPIPDESELALFQQLTGRTQTPTQQAREAFFVVGRRGGKSRIGAVVAVFLACFRDYSTNLAAGERGVVMLIASDRRQARVLKRYVSAFLRAIPMLAQMLVNETAEGLELNNQIIIEIHTASFRSTRGYTVVAAILDEIAFWPTDEAASPDSEILNALRPAMATVPGALLLAISSPYARRGELWKAHKAHFGRDDDPVLVIRADTKTMNPGVPDNVIATAYADDEAVARAEYGAEFRTDVETFVRREAVEACVVPGRFEVPALPGQIYSASFDGAGGSGGDAATCAVAHTEQREGRTVAVLDVAVGVTPPFSPDNVVANFCVLLTRYHITKVYGDRWAGEWPREQFLKAGISYEVTDKSKSEHYKELLPAINSGSVELIDHPTLLGQLCGLERRTARGGKDSIDHGPNGHDDFINAVAIVLNVASREGSRPRFDISCAQTNDDELLERRSAAATALIAEACAREKSWFPNDCLY